MRIPAIDTLVYRAFWALDHLGRIQTVRDLSALQVGEVRRILVAVTTALGDSVCFTPALTALRARFPRARIVGLYNQVFAGLYRDDPRLDAVIPYRGKYVGWRETLRALRAERCELALVPYINDPDVIPLIYLGGSRVIFRTPGRDTIYRFMVANPELLRAGPPTDHALVQGASMLRHLGCRLTDLTPSLHVTAASQERVAGLLSSRGVPREARLIALHPGASVENKRWPIGNFIALGRSLLAAEPDAHLVLTGAPAERALVRQLAAGLERPGRVSEAAGTVRIEELPALLARMDLLISADTGVAHVAYAVGTPSVTLFWRSDPALSGPMHDLDRHLVVARQPLCPPCRTRSCRYPACADEITPGNVLDAALPLLERRLIAPGKRS